MLKKTITYKDLDDNDVTEDFYFNLSEPEIVELEVLYDGGLEAQLRRFTKDGKNDGRIIMETFRELLERSIGRRGADGKQFIKDQAARDAFFYSNAYPVFFMELTTNADAGAAFVRGIVPSHISEKIGTEVAPAMSDSVNAIAAPVEDKRAKYQKLLEDPSWVPTQQQLVDMPQDMLVAVFQRKNSPAPPPS